MTEFRDPNYFSRKTFVKRGGLLVAGLSLGRGALLPGTAAASNVGTLDFRNPVRIPPLLAPHIDADGRKVFDIRLQTGTSMFLPGTTTATWGANGAYLGPTIRASRGDGVLMHVHNHLPQVTTLHWHGMHLPAVDDGGPHQTIEPGATWSPHWTIDQQAAPLWYHPHPMGQTANQVYRGIAGMFIIDDSESDALPLPHDYGVDDIPLVIQDKRLNKDGSLNFDTGSIDIDGFVLTDMGRLGNTILINGTYNAHLTVSDERVRFRMLNGSDARIYNIGFVDGREFDMIGSDEGLLERPLRLKRIQLAPAERAEIVATFRPGDSVVLRSFPPNLQINLAGLGAGGFGAGGFGGGGSFGANFEEQLNGGGETMDLLQIRAATNLRSSPAPPDRLVTLPPVDVSSAVRTRQFELQRNNAINGQQMNMDLINFATLAGTTEIWEVSGFLPHDWHVHGVSFRVIDIDGNPPPPQIAGLKDTVYVPPGSLVRILVPFGRYTDPHHPYMYHCHILEHEDAGMMGQFVVIKPGQESQVGVEEYHATEKQAEVGPGKVATVVQHGSHTVKVVVDPNRALRPNTFNLQMTKDGRPVTGADVALTFAMADMVMGEQEFRLKETAPGSYFLRTSALLMAGPWKLSFSVTPKNAPPFNLEIVDQVDV